MPDKDKHSSIGEDWWITVPYNPKPMDRGEEKKEEEPIAGAEEEKEPEEDGVEEIDPATALCRVQGDWRSTRRSVRRVVDGRRALMQF